jgi:hypothetical protein
MIYESKAPRQRLMAGGQAVQFRPSPELQPNGEKYGYFETTGSDVQLAGFTTADECEKFLAESTAAKRGRIWPRAERLAKAAGQTQSAARQSVVDDMTEAQLRGIINGSGVACPGEGTEISELRAIAAGCLAGTIKAGTVAPATPNTEETPVVTETADDADAPAKKNKKTKKQ